MPADGNASLRDRPRLGERVQRLVGRLLLRLPESLIVRLAKSAPPVVDGQRLDAGVHLLLVDRAKRVRYGLIEPTIAAGRARYRRDTFNFAGRRTSVGSVRELTVDGAAGPLGARLYRPPAPSVDAPLLVYMHGGGFVIGDLDTHDEPCRVLCRHAHTAVLSVAYRLAPEHPFPAAVDDALAVMRWAKANARALGVDPSRISIGGDSAGGNLAAVVAQRTTGSPDAPAAQLLIFPVTDPVTARPSRELFAKGLFLTMRDVEAFGRTYAGGQSGDPRDPRVAPFFAPEKRGLAPALVITAGFDVLRDEGEAYARALRDAGTTARLRRFPSLIHGFIHITDVSPTARDAMVAIAKEWAALRDGAPALGDDLGPRQSR
ncbi:MAG: alpha/beta hydrolase [Gemmatimonadaceae bacterium]